MKMIYAKNTSIAMEHNMLHTALVPNSYIVDYLTIIRWNSVSLSVWLSAGYFIANFYLLAIVQ